MPWTSATEAFENAIRSVVAPSIIASRAARFAGIGRRRVRMFWAMRPIALGASPSVYGLAACA